MLFKYVWYILALAAPVTWGCNLQCWQHDCQLWRTVGRWGSLVVSTISQPNPPQIQSQVYCVIPKHSWFSKGSKPIKTDQNRSKLLWFWFCCGSYGSHSLHWNSPLKPLKSLKSLKCCKKKTHDLLVFPKCRAKSPAAAAVPWRCPRTSWARWPEVVSFVRNVERACTWIYCVSL